MLASAPGSGLTDLGERAIKRGGSTSGIAPRIGGRTMDTVVERCLADVVADQERQGGIDEDDVSRLVTAHRLDGEQTVALWAAVAARGIVEDSAASADDG